MRAVVVEQTGPIDSPTVQQRDVPVAGPGDVLVDVHTGGVNFPDAMVIEGTYQVRPPVPFVPGKELAGTVRAVGDEVEGIQAGDRVLGQVEYGAWAEQVVVPASLCMPVPDAIDFDQAVSLGLTYQTAWFALRERARLVPGETVLVTGAAGGVGLAAVQLVKAMGGIAIAGVRHESQHALVRASGAEHVVDLGTDDPRSTLKTDVMALTDGRGVDVVLENVGGAVFDGSIRALGFGGRLVVIGFASGEIPTVKAGHALVKNIAITGLNWALYRDLFPARVREAQAEIFAHAAAGEIEAQIMQTYPLSRFAQALARLRAGTLSGQLVLDMKSTAG